MCLRPQQIRDAFKYTLMCLVIREVGLTYFLDNFKFSFGHAEVILIINLEMYKMYVL